MWCGHDGHHSRRVRQQALRIQMITSSNENRSEGVAVFARIRRDFRSSGSVLTRARGTFNFRGARVVRWQASPRYRDHAYAAKRGTRMRARVRGRTPRRAGRAAAVRALAVVLAVLAVLVIAGGRQ